VLPGRGGRTRGARELLSLAGDLLAARRAPGPLARLGRLELRAGSPWRCPRLLLGWPSGCSPGRSRALFPLLCGLSLSTLGLSGQSLARRQVARLSARWRALARLSMPRLGVARLPLARLGLGPPVGPSSPAGPSLVTLWLSRLSLARSSLPLWFAARFP
jgi:hypothetical protein